MIIRNCNTHLVLLVLGLLSVCISCVSHEVPQPDHTKTPVFFIHGHGCSADYWKPMMRYLARSGYPVEYLKAIQLRPNNGSNILAAEEQIAPAIQEFIDSVNEYIREEHLRVSQKMKVDLISHSMGALSARWYVSKLHPEKVRVWISLAGANHGTDALCGYSGEGANDMCPAYVLSKEESFIQYVLNGNPHVTDVDETPYGVGLDSLGVDSVLPDQNRKILYVTIRLASDRWIRPEDSATLDGCGGVPIRIPKKMQAHETSPGNILVSRPIDHDELIIDKATMELVKIILQLFHSRSNSKR